MSSKHLEYLEVHDRINGVECSIPLGICEGAEAGPTLAVIAGVHATEYAARDGVLQFWRELDPSELTGRVLVVLTADPVAVQKRSAYINPIDGKNLNRVWPGDPNGTLTEVIADVITREVVSKADAVIDVHGGEWDEEIELFIITHRNGDDELDRRTLDLAVAAGFPFVEVTEAGGAVLGVGTGSGAAVLGGTPAMTLEAGGRALAEPRFVDGVVRGLENISRRMGIKQGEPSIWCGQPVVLDHGILLKTQKGGTFRPCVGIGRWIGAGAIFGRVFGPDGDLVEDVIAPEEGVILDIVIGQGVGDTGYVGKIGVCPPLDLDGAA